ncbi:DUF4386 domain-containing protein [Marivirga arenosa]|uniref:DUF4386 domain-containing protein n=1 Tax=Marivirga arenosa TaxID=3059076 RepID=A0AA51N7G1_9BACT|nr:DUF4386 domain-containing protein [Marivirga sp. ABR2-2]WMN07554.1 DUF4386 domain-containing protein [Marivirga sp. ABR2-2]
MTTINEHNQLIKTARVTGIWYLLLAITGVFGFMVFNSQVYSPDANETLNNLIENQSTARIRLLFEFGIIISQALTAIWFYRLFKGINDWAALATAIWGTVNSSIILISAISMGVAIKLSSSNLIADNLIIIETLQAIIANAWLIGGLFFGLWLLPFGYIITSSKRMPVWLGRILILGGFGYIISTFLSYGGISADWVGYFQIPASIGEFWMIGYLLIFGIRPAENS